MKRSSKLVLLTIVAVFPFVGPAHAASPTLGSPNSDSLSIKGVPVVPLTQTNIDPALGYAAAASGANADITSIGGLATPSIPEQGGTGAKSITGLFKRNGGQAVTAAVPGSDYFPPLSSTTPGMIGTRGDGKPYVTGCFPLEAFGGKGDGATQNDAAWSLAATAVGLSNGCVSFGPGQFDFANGISLTLAANQSIKIVASGKEVTFLNWPTARSGGITLNRGDGSTFTVSDMTIETGVQGGGYGLNITDTSSDRCAGGKSTSSVVNVAFKGSDGLGQYDYWNNSINSVDLNLFDVINSDFIGEKTGTKANGIVYSGTPPVNGSAGCLAVINNVTGSYFELMANHYTYGTYAQGVTIFQSNFNGGTTGVYIPTTDADLDQLTVIGNQFNTSTYQIYAGIIPQDLMIDDNLFLLPNGTVPAITINMSNSAYAYSFTTIRGNHFRGQPGQSDPGMGISIVGGSSFTTSSGIISGNIYGGLSKGNVFAQTANWNVQSNSYPGTTTPNDTSGGCANCTIGQISQ